MCQLQLLWQTPCHDGYINFFPQATHYQVTATVLIVIAILKAWLPYYKNRRSQWIIRTVFGGSFESCADGAINVGLKIV